MLFTERGDVMTEKFEKFKRPDHREMFERRTDMQKQLGEVRHDLVDGCTLSAQMFDDAREASPSALVGVLKEASGVVDTMYHSIERTLYETERKRILYSWVVKNLPPSWLGVALWIVGYAGHRYEVTHILAALPCSLSDLDRLALDYGFCDAWTDGVEEARSAGILATLTILETNFEDFKEVES
jgi:hypothetical protein